MNLNEILAGFGGEPVQRIIQDNDPNWTEEWTVIIAALSLLVAGVAVWMKRRSKKE